MDPKALLEYLGYECEHYDDKVVVEFDLIYKTIDDYNRVKISKFSFQYMSDVKTVCRFFSVEGVSLPVGHAEDVEEAIALARTYLERVFTDLKFGIMEDKKFLRLWEEKKSLNGS